MKNKQEIINKIKAIVNEYDSFYAGTIEPESSVCIDGIGGTFGLVEFIDSNDVEVYVYNGVTDFPIHTYRMSYEDMNHKTLTEIHTQCRLWKKINKEQI